MRVSALVLASVCLVGCPKNDGDRVQLGGADGMLFGTVMSWGDFQPIPNATIDIEQWPRVFNGAGSAVVASEVRRWTVTTNADGLFELNPYQVDHYDVAQSLPPGRTRFRVMADGYDKSIFYADVDFTEVECESDFAGGALIGCQELTLDMVPAGVGDADLMPDVTVEASTLADCRFEQVGAERRVRVSVGTPNVGRGPVELRSVPGSGVVRQVIHRADGSTRESILEDAAFEWAGHEDHNHFHFEDWSHIKVRSLQDIEINRSNKISFCLIDLDGYDDEIYQDVWGAGGAYGCGVVDGEILQGLSAGRMDTYSRGLEGQHVDVTNLEPGDYFLEVTVDPLGFIAERDETNNSARVLLHIPEGEVGPSYNPCQPEWLQPGGVTTGPTDPDPIDTTGRTELSLSETCGGAEVIGAGSYYGQLEGFANDVAYGAGEDGVVAVLVPAGELLRVTANLSPGDVMIRIDDDCAADGRLAQNDQNGSGQPDALTWRNQGTSDQTVMVILDNFERDNAGTFALDLSIAD